MITNLCIQTNTGSIEPTYNHRRTIQQTFAFNKFGLNCSPSIILSFNRPLIPLIIFGKITLFYADALESEIVYNNFIGEFAKFSSLDYMQDFGSIEDQSMISVSSSMNTEKNDEPF